MQAIWRIVQALGLTDNYCNRQDLTLKDFVQKMAAISLCPPAFVHTAWLGVQQEAPQIARVDELVDYFTRTWVTEWSVSSEAVELLQGGWPSHQQPNI